MAPGHLVPFDADDRHHQALAWGGGHVSSVPVGGIYMASTVADSTRVWPALVDDHAQIISRVPAAVPGRRLDA